MHRDRTEGDITALLARWNAGDRGALNELLGAVHGELRELAANLLRREQRNRTLQPTDLVHEAFLRLSGLKSMSFEGRRHFYGAAAESMRRILVDHARQRAASKRGGPDHRQVPLEHILNVPLDLRVDFVQLDEALTALASLAPVKARVVELRFFAGMSIAETAETLDISVSTVKRHWEFARVWLLRELDK